MKKVAYLICGLMFACLTTAILTTSQQRERFEPVAQLQAQEKAEPKPMPKGDEVVPAPENPKATGLILPPNFKQIIAASYARHQKTLKALPTVTATKFDCREMGWVSDFDNQGNCGSCWVFSGADPIACAMRKAGYGKVNISKQQLIDCHFRGACNGGWPEDIAKVAKSTGVVTDDDYGVPYHAGPGQCKSIDASKVHKIADYGFVGDSDGVPSYQAMKDCMVKFGVLSVCYDASGTPSSGEDGPVWKGTGGRGVNHAIKAIAFDDSKSPKGAILCWNQWNNGPKDLFWCEWGANQMGTATMWVTAVPLPTPIVVVTIAPTTATLATGGTQQFTAKAEGSNVQLQDGSKLVFQGTLYPVLSDEAARLKRAFEAFRKEMDGPAPKPANGEVKPMPVGPVVPPKKLPRYEPVVGENGKVIGFKEIWD